MQGEIVEAARFGAHQRPMTAQEREEQGKLTDLVHSPEAKKPKLDSPCVSGLGGGQPTLVNVKTAEELTERLEKIEKEKQKWKDKCHEYQKLIEKEREKSDRNRQVPQNGDITRLKEENTKLNTTVDELREKNLKLTRQVLDLQYDVEKRSAHQCNCQLLQVLLDRAKDEAKEWESEANRWMIEYEVAQRSSSY